MHPFTNRSRQGAAPKVHRGEGAAPTKRHPGKRAAPKVHRGEGAAPTKRHPGKRAAPKVHRGEGAAPKVHRGEGAAPTKRHPGKRAALIRDPLRGRKAASRALLLSWLAFSVHAEDAAKELDEIVVTAGLQPLAAEDVAGSLTVITREEIERRQVQYLSELLRDVPGFAVSQAGGTGSLTQVRVRGAEANHLLVLIDGVRANDPASGDEFQFQQALTADIERVEIIRGPQSATWGTDALAGVINIIRRSDVEPGGSFIKSSVEGGSFGSLKAGVQGGMQHGRATLSGGMAYLESDGTNISRASGEDDGTENATVDGRFEYAASESLLLTLTGQHIDARSDFDGVSFVTGLPEDADLHSETDRTYLSGMAALSRPDSRWDASASLHWLDSDNSNYSAGAWESATAADSLELQLRTSMGLIASSPADHRLTLAFDYRDVSFTQRGVATDFGNPNQDQGYDVSGYAAEYVGRPVDGLTWTLSARRDDYSAFEDATTWRLAASKRWDNGFRLRGSLGTGSKAPTFIERFGFYPDFFQGNPDLEPESSTGWEVGVDFPVVGSDLSMSATWFDQELEDEIDGFVFDPASGLFTAVNRPGASARQGIELVLAGPLTDSLSFDASYTWTDATESGAASTPRPEIRRPEHMANLNLNQAFADGRGNVNLNVSYNGAQLDHYFPPPAFARTQVELDGFTLVDLAVSWALTARLEVTGRITNLLDEHHEEIFGFARPGIGFHAGLRGHFSR